MNLITNLYEVEEASGVSWHVYRKRSNLPPQFKGTFVARFRTAKAAEHAAASLRWAEVIDQVEDPLIPARLS